MKKYIYILLFPILILGVFIIVLYFSAKSVEYRTYYFPQIKTYMDIYIPSFDKYLYIKFNNDSILQNNKRNYSIKIYRSEINMINFIFDTMNNKIYVLDNNNHVKFITHSELHIKKIEKHDTSFFTKTIYDNLITHKLKSKYFGVFLYGDSPLVYYSDYNGLLEANLIK